jgi:hypothetical protein
VTNNNPHLFREFVRDYVDDVVRIVTLGALGGALYGHRESLLAPAAALFLTVLTAAMLYTMSDTILEYADKRFARLGTALRFAIAGINLVVQGCVFFLLVAVVSEAVRP